MTKIGQIFFRKWSAAKFKNIKICTQYSSNEIRKTQNEHLNIVFKILTVCNCEFDANFLTSLGLYLLLFALETIGVS